MISQGGNTFPCNVMHTNQGLDRLFQAKSHVQTACESHDLNMDFCGFKQLLVTNSYARSIVSSSLIICGLVILLTWAEGLSQVLVWQWSGVPPHFQSYCRISLQSVGQFGSWGSQPLYLVCNNVYCSPFINSVTIPLGSKLATPWWSLTPIDLSFEKLKIPSKAMRPSAHI